MLPTFMNLRSAVRPVLPGVFQIHVFKIIYYRSDDSSGGFSYLNQSLRSEDFSKNISLLTPSDREEIRLSCS